MEKREKYALAVIYGGDSTERDISVITAVQAMKALSREYVVCPLLLEDGAFYIVSGADEIKSYIGKKQKRKRVYLEREGVYIDRLAGRKLLLRPDCCLICTHGGKGENGALQGYLDVIGMPYTSAGVAASAIGMDKALSKTVFSALGLNVTPYVTVADASPESIDRVVRGVGYPVIVKPVSQGSSIGIAVAKDAEELGAAIETALAFDDRAVCEKALTDFTELNCAVLVRDGEVFASELEQPLSWEEFLSFEEKYLAGGGKLSGGGRVYPAKVPPRVRSEVRDAAVTAYKGMGAKGVVRIDFLLDNTDGRIYINEANTVPGSLATYLFADCGMGYADVVACAVDDALTRAKSVKKAKYDSKVLSVYGKSSANACKMHGKIL